MMNSQQAQARLGKILHRFQKVGANYLYGRKAALLADEMGLGKAQPVSEVILRPDGDFTPIGKIQIGDRVVGSDGLPTQVLGVFRKVDVTSSRSRSTMERRRVRQAIIFGPCERRWRSGTANRSERERSTRFV